MHKIKPVSWRRETSSVVSELLSGSRILYRVVVEWIKEFNSK